MTVLRCYAILLIATLTQLAWAQDDAVRTDIKISGVYPHLTTYGIYSQDGAHRRDGHNECGIGAIVPWAGKLWMVNYAPHMPRGSEHKLFSVDADLTKPLTIHPESVGGTPAGRMIHRESNQLLIAHYLIDAQGHVRVISPNVMPMRVTAIARHLVDPANMVYYIDMEGAIWEANVHTLDVKRLFEKPVPGWHSKGGYTSQGRLVISNNGELAVGNYDKVLVGGKAESLEDAGVLAEWDGKQWRIVERRQFTDVTGPAGITGGGGPDDPLWAIGWDRRSLRLKLLDHGQWLTYLLPKAAYCNDARHGWYTEWPRIRKIVGNKWMMDMHGMFFEFPATFSQKNSGGIRPLASHLRYVPDFCEWNGQLVLATDETSIQGNELAGQPQSNLWFGNIDDLAQWGPRTAYGGPWLEDEITAGKPSDPFLIAGFDRVCVHLALGKRGATGPQDGSALRTTDQIKIKQWPEPLQQMPRVTVARGDWHQAAPGFEFSVNQAVKVYLAVDERGAPKLDSRWQKTDWVIESVSGESTLRDLVYMSSFSPGKVSIPGNATEHKPGSFGMPHLALVQSDPPHTLKITTSNNVTLSLPTTATLSRTSPASSAGNSTDPKDRSVTFTLQVDSIGDGVWKDLQQVTLKPHAYGVHVLPPGLKAEWLRIVSDRDCTATAFLHLTSGPKQRATTASHAGSQNLFAGLAEIDDPETTSSQALVYPAKQNRNLRVIADGTRNFEFTKSKFDFRPVADDAELSKLLQVKPLIKVDQASVLITASNKRWRLPKGTAAFDRELTHGLPRMLREVESERQLANIHGTFYELPLIVNGEPPAYNLMRPVASHSKRITDYCSWNGLLVLAGVRHDAQPSEHIFINQQQRIGLWFGGVDDLWKLGKPKGQGGPWFDSDVRSGEPSDAYLMTGYDRKRYELSHSAKEPCTFRLEVDITGFGHWREYQTITVAPGTNAKHNFPEAFSACWIRAVSDRDAKATFQLTYE